jgi:prepilin-type N-terminal cleavage/methylation domain-containing protein
VKPLLPHPRPSLRRRQPSRAVADRRGAAGFSLVELMISTLIFAMVTAGSLGMFTITTRQATLTRRLQEEEFAIRMDQATIQSMNDRFTCASGSCQISGSPPGQNDYFPSSTAAVTKFTTLCSNGQLTAVPDASYGSGLVSLINATNRTAAMQSLGITRSVSADATSPAAHRYTVSWTGSDGTVLRQISLVPTTAAWCP